MTVRSIIEYPDERLRQVAVEVTEFDAELHQLVDDLLDTFRATTGIGLCAPQLGDARRVLVVDASDDRDQPVAYVNPQIMAKRGMCFVEERCLSVPDFAGLVRRSPEVLVRAQDRDGELFERHLSGMDAVCMQHEIDHLEGVLFVDRLSWWRKIWFRRAAQRRAESQAATAA